MPMEQLSHEEKAKVAAEYELVCDLIARRHGVTMHEIGEAVKWVKTHREYMESMKRAGVFALIGFLASALVLALWEGLKVSIKKGLG